MGEIKKIVFNTTTNPTPLQNNRMTVELCENVHLHYRNLRLEFAPQEFLQFLRNLQGLDLDKIKNFDYKDKAFQVLSLDMALPDSTEWNDRLQLEEQTNGSFHLHYRNLRIEFELENKE